MGLGIDRAGHAGVSFMWGSQAVNIVEPILRHARTRPEAPALVEGDRVMTYRELRSTLPRTAAYLKAVGIARGDRVGLCLKDTAEHLITLLALSLAGAVPVPLDWRASAAENQGFARALDMKLILAEPDARLSGELPVIALDAAWRHAAARAEPTRFPPTDWHDPFVVSASSGSTGAPKFTLMTHQQYHFAAAGTLELMALTGRHRFLSTLPLYYSGGRNSCMAHLLRGDCIVLAPSLLTPTEYVEMFRHQQATVGVVVPSLVRRFLRSPRGDLSLPDTATIFCTGAPLHAEEKRAAVARLTPGFQERYGTAETLVIAASRAADFADRPDSVGQPHSLADIEVVDDDDRPLPDGAAGRLRYRGPGLASPVGPAARANFRGGWFYPGEIARLDELGYIFLRGRDSDVIMRHGAKIHPAEVEIALQDHPAVAEAAVIGDREDDAEEMVVAFVVTRQSVRVGELVAHCRVRLTPHKVPRRIIIVPELPRNTAGKTDKRALARLAASTS